MDIIVLAGGLSTERDVSFKTGSMVASAMKAAMAELSPDLAGCVHGLQ